MSADHTRVIRWLQVAVMVAAPVVFVVLSYSWIRPLWSQGPGVQHEIEEARSQLRTDFREEYPEGLAEPIRSITRAQRIQLSPLVEAVVSTQASAPDIFVDHVDRRLRPDALALYVTVSALAFGLIPWLLRRTPPGTGTGQQEAAAEDLLFQQFNRHQQLAESLQREARYLLFFGFFGAAAGVALASLQLGAGAAEVQSWIPSGATFVILQGLAAMVLRQSKVARDHSEAARKRSITAMNRLIAFKLLREESGGHAGERVASALLSPGGEWPDDLEGSG